MCELYLFRSALRDMIRPKRLAVVGLLIALPTLIALAMRHFMPAASYDADLVYNLLSAFLVFGFLLVILAVVFGTGVISQEVEQKTIVYLLTRPVPRWRIVLSKFAAALLAIAVTVWVASLLLAVAAYGFGGARERTGKLSETDILNVKALAASLAAPKDPLSEYLQSQLDPATTAMLTPPEAATGPRAMLMATVMPQPAADEGSIRKALSDDLNGVIDGEEPLYDRDRFAKAQLSAATLREAETNPSGKARSRLNRRLLVEAYPGIIAPPKTVFQQVTRDGLVLLVGAMAYGALFLLLATFMRRPLLWGLLFAFGWESWVPYWPGRFQLVSLMTYLRVLSPHPKPDTDVSGGLTALFTAVNPEVIANSTAWAVLGCTIVFGLLGSLLIFSNREYVPREDAE